MTDTALMQVIQAGLDEITEEQIRRAGSKLDDIAEGEKPLGTIHSEAAKKLFVLANTFKSSALKELAISRSALNDEEEKLHDIAGDRYTHLADFVHDLWWAVVREDMNHYEIQHLGIRKDWMMVEGSGKDSGAKDMLMSLLRGLSGDGD